MDSQKIIINTLLKTKHKRIMRRVLAMLSVVVLLFTFNTFKYSAITLERTPTCGYPDHVHGEDCYNEDGVLICARHEHTDACYQQTPDTAKIAYVEETVEETPAKVAEELEEAPYDIAEEILANEETGDFPEETLANVDETLYPPLRAF
ncbi:MAG: hypothetical protein IJ234_02915 [Clostridia bacterium]|nr:hypothetical protein [Clostridia bacterium]